MGRFATDHRAGLFAPAFALATSQAIADPDELSNPPEALAFEAARHQYLKEQFIFGRDEVPELNELPEPEAPEQHGPDIEP